MRDTGRPGRFLAGFLTIVGGVLVALAVDEWREARADRLLEQEYVERLTDDLYRARATLESLHAGHSGALRNADFVWDYVVGGGVLPADTATVLAALYRASRSLAPGFAQAFPRATLTELQYTGRLALIQDAQLRGAILNYYIAVDETGATLDLLPQDYRDFVRRRIPAAFQDEVRSVCDVFDTGKGSTLDCDIPTAGFDASAVLRDVAGNTVLAGDLNLSRQQLQISIGSVSALLESTDALLERLEASRGSA